MPNKLLGGMRSENSLVDVIQELTKYRGNIQPYINGENFDETTKLYKEPASVIHLIPTIDPWVNKTITLAVLVPQTALIHSKDMNAEELVVNICNHTSLRPYYYFKGETPSNLSDAEWWHRKKLWVGAVGGQQLKVCGVTFFLCDQWSLIKN